ncbi:MAG: tail fiber protein [Caulobacter sp.]|nr:tail fiber protein [Caulobacter sp.]
MAEYFLGEIRIFPMAWPPQDWALCNGASLAIGQAQALYSLLGQRFGGSGNTTFQLPDLRGRTPVHGGGRVVNGAIGGSETVTLTQATMPPHTHAMFANPVNATVANAAGNVLAVSQPNIGENIPCPIYSSDPATITLNPGTISNTGENQSHANIQPSLVLNFCISTVGNYPPRP